MCLGIMVEYRVGLRTIRILQIYWGLLTMVARAGRYFVIPFKGYHSITQGKPLFPTIFNVVVDAVIRYWLAVVEPTKDGTEVLGLYIQDLAVNFYGNDVLVTLTHTERIQSAFDVLTGLFDQVSLWENTWKTVSMACQTCHATGQMSLEAYER